VSARPILAVQTGAFYGYDYCKTIENIMLEVELTADKWLKPAGISFRRHRGDALLT